MTGDVRERERWLMEDDEEHTVKNFLDNKFRIKF